MIRPRGAYLLWFFALLASCGGRSGAVSTSESKAQVSTQKDEQKNPTSSSPAEIAETLARLALEKGIPGVEAPVGLIWAPPTEFDEATLIQEDFDEDGDIDAAAVLIQVDPKTGERLDSYTNRVLAVGLRGDSGALDLVHLDAEVVPWEPGGPPDEPNELSFYRKNGVLCVGHFWCFAGGSYDERCFRFVSGRFQQVTESSFDIHRDDRITGFVADLETGVYTRSVGTVNEAFLRLLPFGAGSYGAVRYLPVDPVQTTSGVQVDGVLDEQAWKDARFADVHDEMFLLSRPQWPEYDGPEDLSFQAGALWLDDGIVIGVAITDDVLVPASASGHELRSDHVEMWFDAEAFLLHPHDDPFADRDKPDQWVRQLGFILSGEPPACTVRSFVPSSKPAPDGVHAAWARTEKGYSMEVMLPFSWFRRFVNASVLKPKFYLAQFGFSIVVSDTDSAEAPRQDCLMGTSELEWGDPRTFGISHLRGGAFLASQNRGDTETQHSSSVGLIQSDAVAPPDVGKAASSERIQESKRLQKWREACSHFSKFALIYDGGLERSPRQMEELVRGGGYNEGFLQWRAQLCLDEWMLAAGDPKKADELAACFLAIESRYGLAPSVDFEAVEMLVYSRQSNSVFEQVASCLLKIGVDEHCI